MNKKYRVLVAHPGKQHSFRLATALDREGLLYKYSTTVYLKPYSLTYFLSKILKGNMKKKVLGRRCTELSHEKIQQFCEFKGLIGLVLTKLPKIKQLWPRWNSYLNDCYGKKVAEYAIRHNIDVVIGYDGNSEILFKTLKEKAPHIIRILDVSIMNRLYMRNEFEKDIQLTRNEDIKIEYPLIWKEKYMNKYLNEVEDANYFFVASEIVKKSELYCGVNKCQIHKIPYGVDVDQFIFSEKKLDLDTPLELIYIGSVLRRKGAHYLFDLVSEYSSKEIRLRVIGEYDKESSVYNDYKHVENIEFLGFITRDKLSKIISDADAFVLPSLAEGFALVILESQSCGLPAIVSENCGGNDIVVDGYNGFQFPAMDREALRDRINWCLENREELYKMRKNARYVAEQYTWENYDKKVVKALNEIFKRELENYNE